MFLQVEPYFTTLALFDVRAGRKLSENFHFDINNEQIRSFLPSFSGSESISNGDASKEVGSNFSLCPEIDQVAQDWIQSPKQVCIGLGLLCFSHLLHNYNNIILIFL